MKICLDTHAILWIAGDTQQLGQKFVKKLNQTKIELLVSVISWWENAVLVDKKRIRTEHSVRDFISKIKAILPARDIALDSDIALLSREQKFSHEDPADRFIAASALANDAILATADKNLLKLDWIKTLNPQN